MARIGVDIGHGSNTFPPSKGVYKNGKQYHEHDANSRVAKRLTDKLKAAGHTVVQAQKPGHLDVHLTNRTNLYFANNVDLIVSAHANAGVSSAHGYAAFYWHNDKEAKKLADIYAEEIKAQGFALWGGSRPSKPNDWSNFHMCRVPSNRGVPSILLENGFMTNDKDFEWIFGSKKDDYTERCATAAFNTIQKFLGNKVNPAPKTEVKSSKSSKSKSISQMADEVIAGKHGQGHDKRRSSLGISKSEYEKVRAEVNRRAGVKTSTPKKSSKSISQMAQEVIDGKHGNGHDNRRKSLGISQSEYNKVRDEVNKRASGGSKSIGKSISQMATEVIQGKHGSGHANRRESLGISNAEYQKVRAEVNRRL